MARRKNRDGIGSAGRSYPCQTCCCTIHGSKHRWFSDDRCYNLLMILDHATSEICYAELVEEESTRTIMAGLREVIESKGLFCALYSDRGSHFFVT